MYNIIWADDDSSVFALKKPNGENTVLADILERKGVRLIATAKNAQELREKLTAKLSWVDAVIIDANFTAFGEKPRTEYILKGFEEGVNLLRTLGENGNRIPFILFSARELDMLQENTEEGYLEYFIENDLYFHKNEDSTSYVIDRLIEEVDRVNTPEHKIRVRYADAFEAASLIDGAEDELLKCLLLDFNHESLHDSVKDRFNAIRRLFDKLYDACKEQGLLPRMPLNSIPKLLDKHDLSGASPFSLIEGETPMHQALVRAFAFFVEFIQDGSHANKDLDLGVLDYVKNSNSQNLLQCIVHIAMDLLIWYRGASERYRGKRFWKGNYKAEGYVRELPRRYDNARRKFAFDSFTITMDDNNPLSEGDYVGIKEYTKDELTGYFKVNYYQYDIIEKHKNN